MIKQLINSGKPVAPKQKYETKKKLKSKQNTHKIPKYTHNNYLIKILNKSRAAKLILAVNSRNEFQMRHATRHQHLLGRPKHKHTHRNEYLNVPIPMHTDRDTNAQA